MNEIDIFNVGDLVWPTSESSNFGDMRGGIFYIPHNNIENMLIIKTDMFSTNAGAEKSRVILLIQNKNGEITTGWLWSNEIKLVV
jgi:hypothetical protein